MALGIVVCAPSSATSSGAVSIVRPNVVFDVPKSSPQADMAIPKRSVRLQTFGMAIQRFSARSGFRSLLRIALVDRQEGLPHQRGLAVDTFLENRRTGRLNVCVLRRGRAGEFGKANRK